MGLGGSNESVGNHSILIILGGHLIPGPIYRGDKKSSSQKYHEIDLIGDHWFKIYVEMLHTSLYFAFYVIK